VHPVGQRKPGEAALHRAHGRNAARRRNTHVHEELEKTGGFVFQVGHAVERGVQIRHPLVAQGLDLGADGDVAGGKSGMPNSIRMNVTPRSASMALTRRFISRMDALRTSKGWAWRMARTASLIEGSGAGRTVPSNFQEKGDCPLIHFGQRVQKIAPVTTA
jgi:hypothetical protein